MLKKLLRHDFYALSRTLVPLNLAVLGAALIATILVGVTVRVYDADRMAAAAKVAVTAVIAVPTVLIAIGVFASAVVTAIIVAVHFYRNCMGDEGYLTFTLPVEAGSILWSKLITGMAWLIINILVIALSVALFALLGTSAKGVVNTGVLAFFGDLPNAFDAFGFNVAGPIALAETLLTGIVSLAAQLLKIYFAVIVGGMLAQKHKLIAAVGVYFGVNIVLGMVTGALNAALSLSLVSMETLASALDTGDVVYHAMLLYSFIVGLGTCALFFLLSRMILKKHFNLQ